MDLNEFNFLKNYFELLRGKSSDDIGSRFINQLRILLKEKEISSQTYEVIVSCVSIGKNIGKDVDAESFKILKNFIDIGVEIKEVEDAKKVVQKLSNTFSNTSSYSTNASTGDYSGRPIGGC